jgi:hypothetical protein
MSLSSAWTRAVRLVLLLLVLILAITPVTQSIWSGDSFLVGYGDTESTLSLVLTFVSLILLLVQHRRRDIAHLLSRLRGLVSTACRGRSPRGRVPSIYVRASAMDEPPVAISSFSFQLPLLI